MPLPSHLGSGLITGTFARWVIDGDDADRDQDIIPEAGLSIELTAEVITKTPLTVISFPAANPPVTYIVDKLSLNTNADGAIVDAMGGLGVRVISNETPGSNPDKWVWRAVVRRDGVIILDRTFSVPVDGHVDLTSVIPFAAGVPVPEWWSSLDTLEKRVDDLPTNPGGGSGETYVNPFRIYANGQYPVRGTVPAGTVIWWMGPVRPVIGGAYAVGGTDLWLVTQ